MDENTNIKDDGKKEVTDEGTVAEAAEDRDIPRHEPEHEHHYSRTSYRASSPKTARLTYSAYSDMRPCPDSKYAPIGIFSYIGMMILFALPVLGFIISIIYSCFAKKLARKRFALASMILTLFVIVLAAAAFAAYIFVLKGSLEELINTVRDFAGQYLTE